MVDSRSRIEAYKAEAADLEEAYKQAMAAIGVDIDKPPELAIVDAPKERITRFRKRWIDLPTEAFLVQRRYEDQLAACQKRHFGRLDNPDAIRDSADLWAYLELRLLPLQRLILGLRSWNST